MNKVSSVYKKAFLDQIATVASHMMQFSPEQVHAAVGVAHHIGFGALAHIGSNAAIKAFRSTAGNRVIKSLGELGVKHGLEGKVVHPFVMDRIKQVVGPEAVAEYTGARNLVRKGTKQLGSSVTPAIQKGVAQYGNKQLVDKGINLGESYAKSKLNVNPNMDLGSYPVLGNARNAMKSYAENGANITKHTGFGGKIINKGTELLDRVSTSETNTSGFANRKVRDVANVGMAAASMAIPGVGDHVLINTLRDTATRIPAGKTWVKSRVMAGLNGNQPTKFFGKFGPTVTEGKGVLGKARRVMGDYLYSPTAWGEAKDFGTKARKDGFTANSMNKVAPLINDFM